MRHAQRSFFAVSLFTPLIINHLSFIKHPESVASINENCPKMCRFINIIVQAGVFYLHSMKRLKNARRSGVMYYNEGEDQQYVQKKKPYNEACDLGHDFDMADDEARAEARREAEARARAEEAIARAEEARARAKRSKGKSGKISKKKRNVKNVIRKRKNMIANVSTRRKNKSFSSCKR
nr:hypothetical protein P5644_02805 [Bacillus velezensis]